LHPEDGASISLAMALDQETVGRATRLAAELMEICRAEGKPLAADYVLVAIEVLTKGTAFETFDERWAAPTKDRSHES
jgi:hypothetical protein